MEKSHLFLGGFKFVDERDVRELLEGFGPLSRLSCKGTFAFAYFVDVNDLEQACQSLDGIVWKNCKLAARIQGEGTGNAQPRAQGNYNSDDGCTVFLGGLSAMATEASVKQACTPYGQVDRVILKPSGYGFVRFMNPSQATYAANNLNMSRILTSTSLTAKVQTAYNRARKTTVRDVMDDGSMVPKHLPEKPKPQVPNHPIVISGFGETSLEDIETAVRDLCWNYGEVLSLQVNPGEARVIFSQPGVSDRMSVEFANGSDWNGHELAVRVETDAEAIRTVEHPPSRPDRQNDKISPRNVVEVRGFSLSTTQDEIQGACHDIFDAFLLPGEKIRIQPKIGSCAVIFPAEQQAHQAATHYSTGASWGNTTLTVVAQGESGSCLGTGRVASNVTKRDLRVMFGLFGTVTKVMLTSDRTGFVDYLESDAAAKAKEMVDGHDLDGVKMSVKLLDPRKPKPTVSNPAPQRYAPY